jgi:hypothetical protein
MAGYDLDDLVGALQSGVNKGQRALRRQQQEVLQQVIDLGENGEPKDLIWLCWLPCVEGESLSMVL